MENKRNIAPESSQLGEPPLKQHKSEAEQENLPLQEEKEDDQGFGQKPAFGDIRPFGSTIPTREQRLIAQRKQLELLAWQTAQFRAARSIPTPVGKQHNSFVGSSGLGQKPAFGDIRPFGETIPTREQRLIAQRKLLELVAWQTAQFRAARSIPMPVGRRLCAGEPSPPFSLISHPIVTEEDGGTSGQTAKLESISAMPAYNYETYESCFTVAGADYCVVAADFTRGHTKISKLSRKCVMVSCGFQADVKALQEALSAENLRYECEHNKPMSCPEMSRLCCDFQKCHPKFVFMVLGGLDSEGKGCVFKHFGVGSTVRRVGHLGSRVIVPPILKYKLPDWDVRLSEAEAVDLAKIVFASATNTGDKLEIVVLNASGLRRECVDLKNNSTVAESSSE